MSRSVELLVSPAGLVGNLLDHVGGNDIDTGARVHECSVQFHTVGHDWRRDTGMGGEHSGRWTDLLIRHDHWWCHDTWWQHWRWVWAFLDRFPLLHDGASITMRLAMEHGVRHVLQQLHVLLHACSTGLGICLTRTGRNTCDHGQSVIILDGIVPRGTIASRMSVL